VTVTGTERLGWDQTSADGQVAQYTYVAYVDGVSRQAVGASCQPSADGTTATCLAPLPHMTAGTHRLQLAAVSGTGVESAMSDALTLQVTPTATAAAGPTQPEAPTPRRDTATKGARFAIETLSNALDVPSAIAVLPDGRILVAESDGDIRVWKAGALVRQPAIHLDDAAVGAGTGLIGITLDPAFAQTHLVYIAYTVREADGGFTNRLVRVVDANDRLFNQAVLLEDSVAETPRRTPRLRFGPDGKLYVLFASGTEPASAQDRSYAGRMLRLNADGTTPSDNPGATPVISLDHRSAAFDWDPGTSEMWLADRGSDGGDVLMQGTTRSYSFDSLVDAADAVFYTRSELLQFRGDLLIAALDARHIRRVEFDPNDRGRVLANDELVAGQYGRISDVAAGPDGAIYFCTANSTADSPDDRLLRIVPASRMASPR
jgi:glucose/arabinose dehydrogenase